jgi:hypothetical protein
MYIMSMLTDWLTSTAVLMSNPRSKNSFKQSTCPSLAANRKGTISPCSEGISDKKKKTKTNNGGDGGVAKLY